MKLTEISTWEDVLTWAGYDILYSVRSGDYSGDLFAIIKPAYKNTDEDRVIGFLRTEYGSCTGCDDLEDIKRFNETVSIKDRGVIIELARTMINTVKWFKTKEDLWLYLLDDVGNAEDWFRRDKGYKQFIEDLKTKDLLHPVDSQYTYNDFKDLPIASASDSDILPPRRKVSIDIATAPVIQESLLTMVEDDVLLELYKLTMIV